MADGYSRPAFKYSHQAGTKSVAQIKVGAGVLRSVTFNTVGATPGTITLADNTVPDSTTNVIAIIVPTASANATTYQFDVAFSNGLTYTAATATTADVTLSYI